MTRITIYLIAISSPRLIKWKITINRIIPSATIKSLCIIISSFDRFRSVRFTAASQRATVLELDSFCFEPTVLSPPEAVLPR